MAGRITHVPVARHQCEGMPSAGDHTRGTIWQCCTCGKDWVVVEGAQYNEAYSAWRPLTLRNRDGSDN